MAGFSIYLLLGGSAEIQRWPFILRVNSVRSIDTFLWLDSWSDAACTKHWRVSQNPSPRNFHPPGMFTCQLSSLEDCVQSGIKAEWPRRRHTQHMPATHLPINFDLCSISIMGGTPLEVRLSFEYTLRCLNTMISQPLKFLWIFLKSRIRLCVCKWVPILCTLSYVPSNLLTRKDPVDH